MSPLKVGGEGAFRRADRLLCCASLLLACCCCCACVQLLHLRCLLRNLLLRLLERSAHRVRLSILRLRHDRWRGAGDEAEKCTRNHCKRLDDSL